MKCSECGGKLVETEPQETDIWLGEPAEGAKVYACSECGSLEAEAA